MLQKYYNISSSYFLCYILIKSRVVWERKCITVITCVPVLGSLAWPDASNGLTNSLS